MELYQTSGKVYLTNRGSFLSVCSVFGLFLSLSNNYRGSEKLQPGDPDHNSTKVLKTISDYLPISSILNFSHKINIGRIKLAANWRSSFKLSDAYPTYMI